MTKKLYTATTHYVCVKEIIPPLPPPHFVIAMSDTSNRVYGTTSSPPCAMIFRFGGMSHIDLARAKFTTSEDGRQLVCEVEEP